MSKENAEGEIHDMIVPRRKSIHGDQICEAAYVNNAWLLDDKFMSFRVILSDTEMNKIISAITIKDELGIDDGRPDLALIFSADPSEKESVDVVVVEIKKKQSNDKENLHSITQLISRAQLLVDYCKNIQRMWYYAIIDVNHATARLLESMNYIPLYSKGRLFYQEFQIRASDSRVVPVPLFIVSYDALVQDAEARNLTFLEILKHAMKHA